MKLPNRRIIIPRREEGEPIVAQVADLAGEQPIGRERPGGRTQPAERPVTRRGNLTTRGVACRDEAAGVVGERADDM